MKSVLLTLVFAGMAGISLPAQEEARFTVEVSTDSVLFGNYFKVTFTLANAPGGQFEPPVFKDFNVVSGPNTSNKFSMMNGTVSQEVSYSYYLEPKDIGYFYISPASIESDGKILETQPLGVLVVPNPDGIKQEPDKVDEFNLWKDQLTPFTFPAPQNVEPRQPEETKPKKKRKVYRM